MPTVIASAASTQLHSSRMSQDISPKSSYPTLAPLNGTHASGNEQRKVTPMMAGEGSAREKVSPDPRRASPHQFRSGPPPKIVVKKEPPSSPDVPVTARHRPRKLDLSSSTAQSGGSRPAAPMTAGASLGMHDVGLACLSPGFQTQDPNMREQLQRSISVRDQQRHIIESRLQKTAKTTDNIGDRLPEHPGFGGGLKTPMTAKKRAPPGLSIVPPSHEQFANERVIQSAPLNQTFTGRHQPHPLTRQVANGPTTLSNSSHIHHVPATQTHNRLPPIGDVFANEGLGINRDGGHPVRPGLYQSHSAVNSSYSNSRPVFPTSPGLPPPSSSHNQPPPSAPPRPREYRSAEEAVAELTSGREDLRPKIVHYSGHHPPTPPSPPSGQAHAGRQHVQAFRPSPDPSTQTGARRRTRNEYEHDNGSPPLGSGPTPRKGPFGEGRDSPETQRKRKEEFLRLCDRAWDLFHS